MVPTVANKKMQVQLKAHWLSVINFSQTKPVYRLNPESVPTIVNF